MTSETETPRDASRGPFTMVIERDVESGWLVGSLVEFPACHTQAPDLRSLEANIREIIDLYLETVDDVEIESTFVGTLRIDIQPVG